MAKHVERKEGKRAGAAVGWAGARTAAAGGGGSGRVGAVGEPADALDGFWRVPRLSFKGVGCANDARQKSERRATYSGPLTSPGCWIAVLEVIE